MEILPPTEEDLARNMVRYSMPVKYICPQWIYDLGVKEFGREEMERNWEPYGEVVESGLDMGHIAERCHVAWQDASRYWVSING